MWDSDRLETLLRCVVQKHSRRGLAPILTAVALAGGPVSPLGLAKTEARRRKKKKNKKPCGGEAKRCGTSCIPRAQCCTNADCGACENCQGGQCLSGCKVGQECQSGSCTCPAGTKDCNGACIRSTACCPVCDGGESCLANGSCAIVCNALLPCPSGCACAHINKEDARHCMPITLSCPSVTQICSSTAECPHGTHCLFTGNYCGSAGPYHCVPLCG